MPYTQDNRLLAIETPLGKDVLLLQSLTGEEALSRPFLFQLVLLSENANVAWKDIIGKEVSIKIRLADDRDRLINGIVSRFAWAGSDPRFFHYQMEVVPWLWLLTRSADCRIFQNMTVPDAIEKVFQARYSGRYRMSLTGDYPKREYCVQYRETDFDFVSRLMEECGIHYFFEHRESEHILVLADSPSAHQPCPRQATAHYNLAAGALDDDDVVLTLRSEMSLNTGKCSLNDYNFLTPDANLEAEEPTVVSIGGNQKFEFYDYPGKYPQAEEGHHLAKFRMQEEEVSRAVSFGTSVCRAFSPGYKFHLEDYPKQDSLNVDYLLTLVRHRATAGDNYTGGEAGHEQYVNEFACIFAEDDFRPARITPRPFVHGPQTALVVGQSGEEIWVDEYGRIKVQFYWDRQGKRDENSSCWIRVAQPWAGAQWGAIWTPRIGQEVVVDFLEGDPDRPLVTGSVYNKNQMPPYALPDNKTRSTFKSSSSKGGGDSQYNELRFEDKKGSEQLFLHAQKDMDLRVNQDLREYVHGNRHLQVGGDQKEFVTGSLHSDVEKEYRQYVGQSMSLEVEQSLDEKTGMKFAHEAGEEIHLKAGANVVIEAGAQLTIKAAGAFVSISPAGVTIQGPMVMINSGGAAGSGSGSSPKDPEIPDTADDGSKGGKMD